MRHVLAKLIGLYQATLSPDHSWRRRYYPYGACKFYPTCSEYTKQAILRFGVVRGSRLGLKRISRCHPWSLGGIDHIPTHA